jgi:hypothetical protein
MVKMRLVPIWRAFSARGPVEIRDGFERGAVLQVHRLCMRLIRPNGQVDAEHRQRRHHGTTSTLRRKQDDGFDSLEEECADSNKRTEAKNLFFDLNSIRT